MLIAYKKALAGLVLLILAMPTALVAQQPPQDELKQNQEQLTVKQQELDQLQQQIEQLRGQHASIANQADLAASQVNRLGKELQAAELQFDQTLLSISATKQDLEQITVDLEQTEREVEQMRGQLSEVLRALYQHDQTSFIDIVLSDASLGTVLSDQRVYLALQERALLLMSQLKERQHKLVAQREELTGRQQELDQLRVAQAYQQQDIAKQRQSRQQFLTLKQEEQASYEHRIAEANQARQEIEQHIFSLKGAGIEVALNDAFSAARFASSVTGVRPSLLLAILKVETNVGENIGTGTFPDDMHPASREAFLRLTQKLGLDPATTPISRRPSSYQGWGGAIGPGQFLADTWERIEGRVAQLMNKPQPDPFALLDAIVGTGIMLADRGAADPAKEIEAVGRFLAGPNWIYHTWYSNRVLAVAEEYVKEGLE